MMQFFYSNQKKPARVFVTSNFDSSLQHRSAHQVWSAAPLPVSTIFMIPLQLPLHLDLVIRKNGFPPHRGSHLSNSIFLC